ncbi:hypothetical protein F4813DRAFT_92697 [Daldinia decipiens]|uniref:uncharacterized protein n=1 Tax=Daldinia decipiens TaxID=326647 RepID=UPI0020C4BDDB|nr:uncharacterized protein F4813DRAFT_92697 [Daldinia decipiens]KAI1657128.1 hypothetical protein F4813DRAFT_92697 [Daldinia decipiens]
MLAKQQTATLLYAALFGSSLVQAAFPTCITSCVRQNGCPPTDVDCMCKKVSGNFLSDVVVCMNQWCSSDTTLTDLVGPIQSNCDIPKSALQAAESKAAFDTGSSSDSASSSDEKPTSTGGSSTAKPSVIMSVGAPYKIDGPTSSTSGPAPTGSATKGSASSIVLSDTTAVVGPAPTASESLLVAATTFTSSAAASTPTSSSSGSSSSSNSSPSSSSDGTPGSVPSGNSTEEGSASSSQASLLAAVLAVGAAMAFGW